MKGDHKREGTFSMVGPMTRETLTYITRSHFSAEMFHQPCLPETYSSFLFFSFSSETYSFRLVILWHLRLFHLLKCLFPFPLFTLLEQLLKVILHTNNFIFWLVWILTFPAEGVSFHLDILLLVSYSLSHPYLSPISTPPVTVFFQLWHSTTFSWLYYWRDAKEFSKI